ncbi:MAG TPA: dihydrolipoamide acetyltransferase family protein [Armatimonadota bacterium]|nr:dihydrolipoamide acetyltransferase family protein [Armatimonadota bacterium]
MPEITMPKMSDTMQEGKVIRWLKHEGDQIAQGEPIAEIETDKANVEMEAFEPGVMKQILVKEGETAPVGQPIAVLETLEAAAAPKAPPEEAEEMPPVTAPPAPEAAPIVEEKPPVPPEAPKEERVKASPLARRMAEEKGIDLSGVQGTGPNGRIVESDVENYLKQMQAAPAPPPVIEAPPKPPAIEVPTEERELSRMRKTIAERMTRSKQTTPHFYVTSEIEMDWASRVRDELNTDEAQTRVSFTDMVIKACALALTKFPEVNASYSEGKLLIRKEINVGFAVALEDGLMAPVVRNADKKSLRRIASETKELAQRARENNLRTTDFTGGTFTISNLGMFDVESFAAIINPPESATLAVGTIRESPVVVDGQVAVSKRMKATISADHRVLDGAVAAEFLNEVKRRLESPISLL